MDSFWRTVLKKTLVRLSSNLHTLKAGLRDYRKDLVDHLEGEDEQTEAEMLERLNCLESLLESLGKLISTSIPSTGGEVVLSFEQIVELRTTSYFASTLPDCSNTVSWREFATILSPILTSIDRALAENYLQTMPDKSADCDINSFKHGSASVHEVDGLDWNI